jgi:hypothetical protein
MLGLLALGPAQRSRLLNEIDHVVDAKLAHDTASMHLYSPLRALQDIRDSLIADTFEDEA